MSRILLCLLLFAAPLHAAPKKILLIGQGSDGHPPSTHEFRAGVRIIGELLARHKNLEVTVVSADGAWKEGPELIGRADCVLLYVSQGFQWMQLDPERLKAFQGLAKRGGGIVGLHWAVGCKDAEFIPEGLKLLGGCHGGPDRKYQVLTTRFQPADGKHPITSGVEGMTVKDEFYYSLKFASPEEQITPVMTAAIDGEPYTVAWAWQRPDGGRSFGFTGLHFHANWAEANYRRLVVQAILWAAKEPLPEKGVNVDIPADRLEVDPK